MPIRRAGSIPCFLPPDPAPIDQGAEKRAFFRTGWMVKSKVLKLMDKCHYLLMWAETDVIGLLSGNVGVTFLI
jgi:hypothetical protein